VRVWYLMGNLFETFAIGLFQRFRMWTADRFEKLVRARLRQDTSSKWWIGSGIHHAISETEDFLGRTEFKNARFDPFNVEPALAWRCEEVASSFGNELGDTFPPYVVLGARFVSAIYAVRSISDSPSERIREKSLRCIEPKILLANQVVEVYREEMRKFTKGHETERNWERPRK
jgi:hypothetical protein